MTTYPEDPSYPRIAHLLLVHRSPGQVARLAKRLQHPYAHIYVHVDAKADIAPFRNVMLETGVSDVEFITDRYRINWSAFSMVEATLSSLRYIATAQKCDFINLLSGEDYPLKSPSQFHSFLSNHLGKSFMEFQKPGDVWWEEAQVRFGRYYLNDLNIKGKFFLENVVNKLLRPRKRPSNVTIVGKSQWFTLAEPHLIYILENEKALHYLKRFFKYSWAPDEFFFQTILYNSPHREEIINNNLRYIDWASGKSSPKIFTARDLRALEASGKFFARKFDGDISHNVLNLLDEWIRDCDV